jgi:uncharacterized membrane protein YidH (DUF202 family)
MIYQNQKLPQVLSIKQLLYSNMQTITVEVLCRISFLLLTGATALAFLNWWNVDRQRENKSYSDANNIALMLIGILLCNPFFLLDYPYLSILQNTL